LDLQERPDLRDRYWRFDGCEQHALCGGHIPSLDSRPVEHVEHQSTDVHGAFLPGGVQRAAKLYAIGGAVLGGSS